MKRVLLSLFVLVLSINAFATAQEPDIIFYNGKKYALNCNPMEAYFEKYPDKRPIDAVKETGLWRGYVATFEVVDNELFLNDIQVKMVDTSKREGRIVEFKSVLSRLFGDEKPAKVDWFSGILVFQDNDMNSYMYVEDPPLLCSDYVLLEFKEGRFCREKKIDVGHYGDFKVRQFEAFRKTSQYAKLKKQIKSQKQNRSDEFIDNFLFLFVIEYSTKILVD